ncbi:DUF4304 domain-containing protein [Dysgonomonas sp. 521]|uniref:DUF4304 domain-containing protein n=1 Tax=Dysgonomonas sp. 521 TaxID=2302932 RepID=UPI0013D6DC8F|nr:DUF4304 domain-containing protein [Dysgonomonas sp. 521]NDV95271.1 DUF4304 domain-containing protein [Dysgonomonas sp. 521]
MAKTEIEKKFDYLVSKIIWPHFKTLGYKKSGNNFRFYNEEGLGKIVNFQKSVYYDKQHIHFTINLGIYSMEIDKYWSSRQLGPKFLEYNCPIRIRIGRLLEDRDIWFDLTNNIEEAKLYSKIENIFIKNILPYLAKFQSQEDIFKALLNKIDLYPYEIKALFYNGYKKRALEELEKEIKRAKETGNNGYLENLIKLEKELELKE